MSPKITSIEDAEKILRQGGVIGLPTETVYGLGAWIESTEGLEKIFSIKERPFFDPLIVHVANSSKARELSLNWNEVHETLASKLWPGPLTIVTKKKENVNSLITSGLDSVGLRCPNHPLALKLLSRLEGGIAAPSANKFGKTSPTTAAHVFDEFGDEVSVIDGGSCDVGIESTVIEVFFSDKIIIHIFRPGFYHGDHFREALKNFSEEIEIQYVQSPVAPGQLKHHYMPKTPIALIPDVDLEEAKKLLPVEFLSKNIHFWELPSSALTAARELYEKMRLFDQKSFDLILIPYKSQYLEENWLGIWNRLEKAKTFDFR